MQYFPSHVSYKICINTFSTMQAVTKNSGPILSFIEWTFYIEHTIYTWTNKSESRNGFGFFNLNSTILKLRQLFLSACSLKTHLPHKNKIIFVLSIKKVDLQRILFICSGNGIKNWRSRDDWRAWAKIIKQA